MTHQIESSRGESSRKAYPRIVELTEIEFARLFDYWANYCWCYSFESFFKNTIPRAPFCPDRKWWPTVRGFEFIPKNWPWTWEKKEKKRVGFGFWSTDGLPREKKKENYQKDKKGLCFKLSYIFTFKSYWQVMIWKKYRERFLKVMGSEVNVLLEHFNLYLIWILSIFSKKRLTYYENFIIKN